MKSINFTYNTGIITTKSNPFNGERLFQNRKEGHTISSIQNMAKGDVFKITLRDGSIKAVVEEVLQDGNITEKL